MTIWAGILARSQEAIPRALLEELGHCLSRHPEERPFLYQDDRVAMAKADVGAWPGKGLLADSDGSLTLLAGRPLLRDGQGARDDDLQILHEALLEDRDAAFQDTLGSYAIAHYDVARTTLTVVSDRLGIRPVYYYVGPHFAVFATAFRVLRQLSIVPARLHPLAVTEQASLGYPLGSHTPYLDVHRIGPSEVVRVSAAERRVSRYWRLDRVAVADDPESVRVEAVNDAFSRAVRLRLGSNRTAVSLLSGGLDSRCIVAALNASGAAVHTMNFGSAGSQDLVLARLFAEHVGAMHRERPIPLGIGSPDFRAIVGESLSEYSDTGPEAIPRPGVVWSGDGGSVGLGHVHVSERIVSAMRGGQMAEAIEFYVHDLKAYVPLRLFRRRFRPDMGDVLHSGIREELASLDTGDPAKAFFVFLLHNDQRRHLDRYYEDIDLLRYEMELPFFDADLLVEIMRTPIDPMLGHRFYLKSLVKSCPGAGDMPWQAYPESVPCPLPAPDELRYQWSEASYRRGHRIQWSRRVGRGVRMVTDPRFPGRVLNRWFLGLATAVHATNLRDLGYIVDTAHLHYTHWLGSDRTHTP